LRRIEVGFIAFSVLTSIAILMSIVFFVTPNGLNAILHVFIIFALICSSVSLGIIVFFLNRKNKKKVFLIINILTSLLSIFGFAQILYNLPAGFSYPISIINDQYVDGTNQVISGIMSIGISVLFLTVFYTIYNALDITPKREHND